ncbi:MAG: GEVED domain-containing protein [Chitinophagales bacterium]
MKKAYLFTMCFILLCINKNIFAQESDPYCVSYGTNTDDNYISFIRFGNISNYSFPNNGDDNGYGDYTNASTWLDQNRTYRLIVFPEELSSVQNYWSIWIDFNQDYNFSSDELIYNNVTPQYWYVSSQVTIPENALLGDTRMRIQNKVAVNSQEGAPTACETFVYGEVEDYTIHIVSPGNSCYTPYNLSVSGVIGDGGHIQFNWNAVPNASQTNVSYQLAVRELDSNVLQTTNIKYGNSFYRYDTPAANTIYEWQVRAICSPDDNKTDWSATHYVSTATGETCSVPSNLAEENLTPTGGLFTWDAVPEASYYQFAGKRTNENWNITNVMVNNKQLSDILMAGQSYRWSVRTYCEGIGYTAWAAVRTFTSPSNKNIGETLLQNNEQAFQFSVSPNPAQHIVNVQIDDMKNPTNLNLQLFDVSGKCVLQQKIAEPTNIALSVSELAEGIYFLAIQNENYSTNQKLMIVR